MIYEGLRSGALSWSSQNKKVVAEVEALLTPKI
jgi:hypothetical protein